MDISLGVVSRLVKLVLNSIDTGVGTGVEAGIAVLGNLLVGLLGGGGGGTLDGLTIGEVSNCLWRTKS